MTTQLAQQTSIRIGRSVEGDPFEGAIDEFNRLATGAELETWDSYDMLEGIVRIPYAVDDIDELASEVIAGIRCSEENLILQTGNFYKAHAKARGRPTKYNLHVYGGDSAIVQDEVAKLAYVTNQEHKLRPHRFYVGIGKLIIDNPSRFLMTYSEVIEKSKEAIPPTIALGPLRRLS